MGYKLVAILLASSAVITFERRFRTMRSSVLFLLIFWVGAAIAARPQTRGVFSNFFNGVKPGKPNAHPDIDPGPDDNGDGDDDDNDDGCKRNYPLTPRNRQQIPFAFRRYGISPNLTEPPEEYVDVS